MDELVDRHALSLAHLAYMESEHPTPAGKFFDAIWAYEWAKANVQPFGSTTTPSSTDLVIYPSLNQLREALKNK